MSTEKTGSQETLSSSILNRLEIEIKNYDCNLTKLRSLSNKIFIEDKDKEDREPQPNPPERNTFMGKIKRDIDFFGQLNVSVQEVIADLENIF